MSPRPASGGPRWRSVRPTRGRVRALHARERALSSAWLRATTLRLRAPSPRASLFFWLIRLKRAKGYSKGSTGSSSLFT